MEKVLKKTSALIIILGTGKKKKELEKLAEKLGIEENIFFAGFKKNPYKYIARSELFVLSSSWEGCPNALLEAMACKTPVISTDCPSGPSEIIDNNINGILVPPGDPDSLSQAMIKLIKDKKLKESLAGEAKKTVEKFRVKKIVSEYEKIFKETINKV